jgi:sorbitol-specific phosphotransferase system component IIA
MVIVSASVIRIGNFVRKMKKKKITATFEASLEKKIVEALHILIFE